MKLEQFKELVTMFRAKGLTLKAAKAKAVVMIGDQPITDADGNELDIEAIQLIPAGAKQQEEEDDPDAIKAEEDEEEEEQEKRLASVVAKTTNAAIKSWLKVAGVRPITGGDNRNDEADTKTFGFKSMGEQLIAVRNFANSNGSKIDARLNTKATGMNESVDSQGGFLLAPEFSDRILEIMHEEENLLDRTDNFDIKGPSVIVKGYDETSRATGSRRGGVRGYWVSEGGTITGSKPKFRQINMSPHKLAVLVYTTEELLDDGGSMLEQIVSRSAAEEINFLSGDSVINGNGAGQPLGILASPSVVSVAKETDQAADSLVAENIVKMFARLHRSARANAVWLINQDVEPQLHLLNVPVGTGGALVYMPPGGLSEKPYGTIYGRPVVVTEFNPTLGDQGDVILADLKQYLSVTRGAVKSAMSMHVQFVTDELAYRFTFRVDGQPWWHSALTPFRGTVTQSPFVVLDARA